MSSSDVVIVGGGLIGLSAAFYLANAGESVVVIDSNERGKASNAAAGMLAPLGELTEQSPYVPLCVKALRRWPAFIDDLRAAVDVDLKINGPGMLRVALDDSEEAALTKTIAWQQELGLPLKLINRSEVIELEPAVTSEVRAAVLSELEPNVEPQCVMRALSSACLRRGVKIISDDTAIGFAIANNAVSAVRTAERTFSASNFIIAGGAWSRTLLRDLGYVLPVHPVRGQILTFGPFASPALRYTIFSHRGYLVPRPDGRVVAGATEERVGFDSSTTDEGIASLSKMAASLSPTLADSPLLNAWAGLRPVSDDKIPLIGAVPGWSNVLVASGHGRNGILLAPYTASLIVENLRHNSPMPAIFDPGRFLKDA